MSQPGVPQGASARQVVALHVGSRQITAERTIHVPRNLRRFQMSRSLVNFPGDNAKHAPDRVPREAHGADPRFEQLRVQHRQQRRAADLGGQVPSPACVGRILLGVVARRTTDSPCR